MTVRRLVIPATLAADALLFFARPLFFSEYSFPWDFRLVQLPLITFLADQLRHRDLPLWDPYTYCGNPIYANIQACFFHPLVFLAAFVSNFAGAGSLSHLLEWIVVLQVCGAGYFTYLLARHLGCSQAGAWASAVVCQTGPYFASRAEHMGAMMAAAWLPAAWYAVILMRREINWKALALLGAAMGMSVVGGSPAATTAVFGSTLLLSLILFAVRLASAASLARTTSGCALGIGASAIVFFPAAELTRNSVAKYRLDWLGAGGGLHWQSLISLVIPNYSHIFDLTNFKGPGDPTFLYLYSSITGLALALLVLAFRRDRWVTALGVLGLLSGLFMLGDSLPLWRTLYPLLPAAIRIGIHPEFTYCVFTQCLALLAGMGLSQIVKTPSVQWALAAVIAVELYAVGSNRPMNAVSVLQEPGLSNEAVRQLRDLSARDFPPARIDNTAGVSLAWAESAPLTRVATGNGCSPFAPERIIQVRLGLHPGGRSGWYYPVENLDSPALDLMNERYLLASQPNANSRFREIARLPGSILYENTTAWPRAVILSSSGIERKSTAAFTAYSPNHIAVTAASDVPAQLVLSEAWYPGWEARLDGQPVPIDIAEVAFRKVVVPAGVHHITMDFRPRILLYSAFTSFVFLIGLAILCTLPFRSMKQSRVTRQPRTS